MTARITLILCFYLVTCGCATNRREQNILAEPSGVPRAVETTPGAVASPVDTSTSVAAMSHFFGAYQIRKGDTLLAIARRFHDSDTLEDIQKRNHISNPSLIREGRTLYVRYGATKISESHGNAVVHLSVGEVTSPERMDFVAEAPSGEYISGQRFDGMARIYSARQGIPFDFTGAQLSIVVHPTSSSVFAEVTYSTGLGAPVLILYFDKNASVVRHEVAIMVCGNH